MDRGNSIIGGERAKNTHMQSPRGEERKNGEVMSEEITPENFPKQQDINPQSTKTDTKRRLCLPLKFSNFFKSPLS